MPDAAPRTPAADRARRHRIRQARRIGLYRVEVAHRAMEMLIEARGLTDEQAADRAYLELHLGLVIEEWVSLVRRKNRNA